MTTANFIYFEPLAWKNTERTPIKVAKATAKAYCYHCHKTVTPNVIVTAFLSQPMDVCPNCNSKIQKERR